MKNQFIAVALTLFFVIDALGLIPTYLALMEKIEPKRRSWVCIRELLFALLIMVCFTFIGEYLLRALSISTATIEIAGGIILFVIAINLVFKEEKEIASWAESEPHVVPIATPLIAGPSVLALIMIYARNYESTSFVLEAIFIAWAASAPIFFFAAPLFRLLGEKGLEACKRLMGLVIAMLAVQMLMQGVVHLRT